MLAGLAIAGGVGLALHYLHGGSAIMGNLVLDTVEPGVRVRVTKDGQLVTVLDNNEKNEAMLPVGTYDLALVDGRDGLKLDRAQVAVRPGETDRAKVTFAMPVTPGFQALFNGKDVSGWKLNPAQLAGWTVENGLLTGRTDQGDTQLFSERNDFGEFQLRAEVKVNDGGSGGIWVRFPFTVPLTTKSPGGYKVVILNGDHPAKVPLTGNILPHATETVPRVGADEWFTLEIIAREHTLTTTVNSKLAVSIPERKKGSARGHLALQAVGPKTVVQFRRLEIKETLAPLAAPRSEYRSLFNGRDLTGWKTHPADKAKWTVNKDGTLTGSGPPGDLFTERDDFENFQFRVEAKINDGGNSGQYFRARFEKAWPAGYEAQIDVNHSDKVRTGSLYPSFNPKLTPEQRKQVVVLDQLHKPNEWFTQEVIAHGNHIVINVNGKKTVDYIDDRNTYTRGHLALQQYHDGSVVTFRKVEVKELPPGPEPKQE